MDLLIQLNWIGKKTIKLRNSLINTHHLPVLLISLLVGLMFVARLGQLLAQIQPFLSNAALTCAMLS